MREAGAADADRFVGVASAAALLRQLREGDRRRVGLDPASQFKDSWMVSRHRHYYGVTVTATFGVTLVRPKVSVTVRRTL